MKILRIGLLFILACLLIFPTTAQAQSYYFQLEQETVKVYWQDDGTASIDYVLLFNNSPSGGPIDYVDIGIPNSNFDDNSISADVNGVPVYDISRSGFQGTGGSGVAIGLGSQSIGPGQIGQVHVFIGTVRNVLRVANQPANSASAVFVPNYFGAEYVFGTTDITVIYHLPPGVNPDEPTWHAAPEGFSSEPETSVDIDGRVTYTWRNPSGSASEIYRFGASFPTRLVPESTVARPSIWELLGVDASTALSWCFCFSIGGAIILSIYAAFRSSEKRKLQYLPPKVSIEGHGIKRGLTAIQAAVLLEQPLDKILTMILFSVIKKSAATVVTREPLEIKAVDPQPADLLPYEQKFLAAFQTTDRAERRKGLQTMMIDLVQSVANEMKGFSRRETIEFYRDITKRAWEQVQSADTPEVKSAKYDEVMEWTMLDKDYDRKTQDVFRTGPVFVPVWWPRYDPGFGRGTVTGAPVSTGGGGKPSIGPTAGGGISLPTLPGGDFAASVVKGTQSFAGSVIGSLQSFTGGVTQKTNPIPVSTTTGTGSKGWGGGTRSGGGGGRSCACACACACAGCACACAGGGR